MSPLTEIRPMRADDVSGVVELQRLAFPPPFSEDLLWDAEHLLRHVELFPEGQFVAVSGTDIVGSCSNTLISEEKWQAHAGWNETVGGPMLQTFAPDGTTLYGLDISVHPGFRRGGIGRRFYERRFDLVRVRGLVRYGTACRMPDFAAYSAAHPGSNVVEYAQKVVVGETNDRTLTPLLRYGLSFEGVLESYMEDEESGNAAAMLEWRP